ncbi:MAG: hypothetical protein AAF944_28560 [Bacteroidota bacterium]
MKKLFYNLSLAFIVSVIGCREEEILPQEPSSPISINGYVQKGPFINGTSIIITELDDSLAATGKTFTTQITDNKGTFFIKTSQLDHTNLQMMASGFYFDEVKGEKSAAQLTLFALADVSEDANINVNILSHLEKDRVNYLITRGTNFLEAKRQAQQEILAIFGIEREEMTNSELLDISQAGDDNAILLAISAILQGNQTVAELSELLADITTDLREDGTLDSETIKAKLVQNAINLDLPQIRQNLQARYQELGVEATIPSFEKFVDSDGDGVLNQDDDNLPDEFVFAAVDNAFRNTTYSSETIVLSGLPYPAIAKVSNGKLYKNGEAISEETIYVTDGDSLRLEVLASTKWNEAITATLQVGDYSTGFSVLVQPYSWASSVTGFLQQGPFTNGSALTITEVDSTLTKTDRALYTKTSNSQGEFKINGIEQYYPWAVLEGKGYYFNMVEGTTSDSELSLVGYTDLSAGTTANVNVLTHLEHRRVKYLVNSGLAFAKAKQQALKEVLAIFEIDEEITTTAEHFDITQNTAEGAMLLAVSATLQGYESTGTVQELLTNISEDIETDGTLDDGRLGTSLINNAVYIDLADIRSYLTERYEELSSEITVADFEKYVKAFKEHTSFEFTKPISYPTSTEYGKNILSDTNNSFIRVDQNNNFQYYSLAANVPENGSLKIVIKGGTLGYGTTPGFYSTSSNPQIFDVSDADIHLSILFSHEKQTLTIEYYEFSSSTPSKIRQITVNP